MMSEDPIRTLLVIEPSEKRPRNSEGSIIELGDGRLFLAYTRFSGVVRTIRPRRSWGVSRRMGEAHGATIGFWSIPRAVRTSCR